METRRPTFQVECRSLIQDAKQILTDAIDLSFDGAQRCLYELALAYKLCVAEVAGRILSGEWVWAGGLQVRSCPEPSASRLWVTDSAGKNGDITMQLAKVLLMDDEPAITDNLAPFLERSGFTVAVADDGERALK
jgi:hypothetical protein